MSREKRCHDCNALEGELHWPGCDMEICPFCGGQLITCNCCYEKLGIDVSEGTWAYENGLTDEQGETWDNLLKQKGLIPYVRIPNLCALCGEVFPPMFHVPDEEWAQYVIPPLQPKVLCRPCYERQQMFFPEGWRAAKRDVEMVAQ